MGFAKNEMFNPMNHPFIFFILSLLVFCFSEWIGSLWRPRHELVGEEVHDYFAIVLGANLTLLGLIIAFTFSPLSDGSLTPSASPTATVSRTAAS